MLLPTPTQKPPVAVAHRSLYKFNIMRLLVVAFCIFSAYFIQAQDPIRKTAPTPYVSTEESDGGYLARIGFNNPKQVAEALMRVEGLYNFDVGEQLTNPVAIVVHGPEVSIFQKENYQEHKEIVDLAAKLSALGILDISVCEVRLNRSGGDTSSIYPFVGTVPFGPTEVNRLLDEENYVYF